MPERDFDVVLYGASGFTGRQTVQYFAEHAPDGMRWAIAGRNEEKLENLRAGIPVLIADAMDQPRIADLVSRTRVLLTTAGPFSVNGDRIVGACVTAGTHYVDITGETAWVRSLIDRYHGRAAEQGIRIIPFCGFDSVPADLGVSLLMSDLGASMTQAKAYFEFKGGSPNGGTVATGLNTYSSGDAERMRDPFLLSPERNRPLRPMEDDLTRARYDKDMRAWVAPFPMSMIDTRVVRRSCSLLGVDIEFQEFMIVKGRGAPLRAAAAATGTALLSRAMGLAFFRDLVRKSAQPGSGPSIEAMDSGWFRCRILGRSSNGRTAEVTMAGNGDPANRITVKCVCESALAVACDSDRLPKRAGVLTPSVGIGEILVQRLRARNIAISVSKSSQSSL